MYPEFVLPPERAQGVPHRPHGRDRRPQARAAIRLEGRRHDPAARHDLSGHVDVHAARHLRGADEGDRQSTMFFHWAYLNETIKRQFPRRADQTGVFIVQLKDPGRGRGGLAAIDATFRNSLAETLTETEKAFQLGFVAMTEAILLAIEAVSFVVIVIIMAVMANTMAMTARERYRRVRDAQGARASERVRRAADLRRVARHRARRRRCSASRSTFPVARRVRAAPWARCSRCSSCPRRRC